MLRVSSGYTIIETMIFLAVSAVILVFSMKFISGRDASASFSQSMRDVQSKVQDWINDASTGFANGTSQNYTCSLQGNHLKIDYAVVGTSQSTTSDCVFLGKAIQFNDDSAGTPLNHEVYAYSVFASRVDSTGELTSSIGDSGAYPTPATGTASTGNASLTELYKLAGSSKVLSVKSVAADWGSGADLPGTDHVVGFYLNFNTEQSTTDNGSESLRAYPFPINNTNADSAQITQCLMLNPPSCDLSGNPEPRGLKTWEICFGNDGNQETAVLTVNSSSGLGATTKLEYKACS